MQAEFLQSVLSFIGSVSKKLVHNRYGSEIRLLLNALGFPSEIFIFSVGNFIVLFRYFPPSPVSESGPMIVKFQFLGN